MKKTYSFTLFLFVSFFVANNVWALKNSGDIQGSYKEVVAYSNGPNTGTSNGEHQCPRYVRRFYKQAFGINIDNPIGVARNYYVNFNSEGYKYLKKSGLVRYSNGGSSLPCPGDILVFDHTNGIGHVSIKKETTNTEIGLIEQNWSRENCSRFIGYVYENGSYRVNTVSSYPVLGWLHMPIGEFSNGWHFDSDIQGVSNLYNLNSRPFTVCYQANGGDDTLGGPINKVHKYPAITSPYSSSPYSYMRQAWIQDFSKNGLIFSLVVNEYVLSPEQGYLGVAYPIGGKHRLFWLDNYWKIGYPVTNEYYYSANKNWIIQWFERLDEEYYVVIYDVVNKNTWYEDGRTTKIPKENFDQHKLKNGTTPNEGVGSSEVASVADYTFNRSLTCEYVTPNSGYSDEPIPRDIFKKGNTANVYFEITDVVPLGLEIRWEWYGPGNILWWQESGDFGYIEQVWHVYNFIDLPSQAPVGQWHVDIFINNKLLGRNYFTVEPAPAPVCPEVGKVNNLRVK